MFGLRRLGREDRWMQDFTVEDRTGETVGDSAYRRIRNDVIFGQLEPGQKLKLEKMSIAYGTSVSTLRETLNRLCSEGFVVAEGQRGFEVTSISASEFQQIAELRELLEGHAIDESFKAGDLDWEALVVSAHHKLAAMERSMLAGDKSKTESWKQCDWQFHRALVAACGSKVLLDALSAAYDKYLRYQMLAVVFRGEVAATEHKELMNAALARDSAKARKILHSHIHDCVAHALQNSDWLKPAAVPARLAESRKKQAKR
ncbi:DNA-binding GntR family transcriptional regulator [Nitrobacteraceae bacterium AZCC 2161]